MRKPTLSANRTKGENDIISAQAYKWETAIITNGLKSFQHCFFLGLGEGSVILAFYGL